MFSGDRAQLCTGRGRRQQHQATAAERAAAYSTWLVEEETVAEWRQHAVELPVTQLLDDGKTLTVFRWSRRQIVAEKVLAAQQRLAFAQGALNERLGGESSPLWEFGWDGCHEMLVDTTAEPARLQTQNTGASVGATTAAQGSRGAP
eukprot:COSAG03_NODE_571_length_6898_cov_13.957641_1_plen_146_part_10